MKLLRTIRLDRSDTFVFERAAEPGEWAVSGAFVFWNGDPSMLNGRERTAFRSGFLGLSSLGWSTLVQIVDAGDGDRAAAVDLLARQLYEHFGAPNIEKARAAAEEEVAFAESLAEHDEDTLIAVRRSVEEGDIRETFRTLRPRAGAAPARAFSFIEVEGDSEPGEDIDLVGLAGQEPK